MKYKKPLVQPISCGDMRRFIDSLPDEFEILGPGERAVVWPKEATKAALSDAAAAVMQQCKYPPHELSAMLCKLYGVAHEAQKRRRVNIWRYEGPDKNYGTLQELPLSAEPPSPWRKVGQCEIEG